MSKLPIGWVDTTLDDITRSISRGKSPKYTEVSELPVVNQKSVRWDGIKLEYLKYVHPDQFNEWPEDKFIQEGDILWNSTGTGTIGRACLIKHEDLKVPKVVDSHITILRPIKEVVESRYLLAWLRGPQVQQEIESLATGSTNQIELSRAMAADMRVPLPPLKEQTRIANKLDQLFIQVNQCRQRLELTSIAIEKLRKSILIAATTGKLTNEWRRGEPSKWKSELATDVCEIVQSGGTPKEGFIDSAGIPFLKIYNIVNQKIDFEKRPQFIRQDIHDGSMSKSKTLPGDVLMNIVGPPLGKVAIVPDDYPEWNINQAITIFRPSEYITSGWLYYVLCAGDNIAAIVNETRGSAGQVNISLSQCRSFIFPVPPLEEQEEIVRRIDILFEYADEMATRCNSSTLQLEQMIPALLEKTFRGELVSQEPSDGSATNLLEYAKEAKQLIAAYPKLPKANKKLKMDKLTNESLKHIISEMPLDQFTFSELRSQVSSDYDSLKERLFELLAEPEPVINQRFDTEMRIMQFKKKVS
jgi:type I restriction enzyme S subunit